MERPSHITFNKHLPWSRRAQFLAFAISIQLAGFWLFTHGLTTHVTIIIHDLGFVQARDKQTPPPKPPEPDIAKKLLIIDPIPQDFKTASQPASDGGGITVTPTPPTGDTGSVRPQQSIIHAAVGISATHTVPPYPPIARRIGAEGKVTFRLTVSAEGRGRDVQRPRRARPDRAGLDSGTLGLQAGAGKWGAGGKPGFAHGDLQPRGPALKTRHLPGTGGGAGPGKGGTRGPKAFACPRP